VKGIPFRGVTMIIFGVSADGQRFFHDRVSVLKRGEWTDTEAISWAITEVSRIAVEQRTINIVGYPYLEPSGRVLPVITHQDRWGHKERRGKSR
jgi:hypothetical protein